MTRRENTIPLAGRGRALPKRAILSDNNGELIKVAGQVILGVIRNRNGIAREPLSDFAIKLAGKKQTEPKKPLSHWRASSRCGKTVNNFGQG